MKFSYFGASVTLLTATIPPAFAQPSAAPEPSVEAQPSVAAQPSVEAEPSVEAQPSVAAQPSVSAEPSVEAEPEPYPEPALASWSRAERLHFDLPAVDVHENIVLGTWPSMPQSMAVTKDAYYLLHGAIRAIPYPREFPSWLTATLDYSLIATADMFAVFVPPFNAWMHEEWHRAVMSRRGISSYNDVYDLPFFSELINVSHVTDEDLTRLKRDHPADHIRMSSAGIEGDLARSLEFDRDRFFFGTRAATLFIEWYGTLGAIGYMATAASDSDDATEEHNAEEPNIEDRDFTGLDPNGWVYDLFRPDEPYADRGVHPLGNGIDRYRSESDLTPRELRYLRAQANLSWLNLINPQLFGLYVIELGKAGGRPLYANASVGHVMAPFGYSVNLNLMAKSGPYGAFAELRAYMSESQVLPGLSAELVRYPLPWAGANLTPRVRLWLQPRDQRFFASSATPGGAIEARFNMPITDGVEVYAQGEAKSEGWIVGNAFLDPALNLRTGLEAIAF